MFSIEYIASHPLISYDYDYPDLDFGGKDIHEIKDTFIRYGFRWGKLVECDVKEVLSGRPPKYFMNMKDRANLYRIRRGIPNPPPAGVAVIFDAATITEWAENLPNRPSREELAWASFNEQQYFYTTPEWKNCAKLIRFRDKYQCWRCGENDKELHVHHSGPIISAYHHLFCLNFAQGRLITVCKDCHKQIHTKLTRSWTGNNFIPKR